jgi:AraC-like DNA-binding protein
VPADPRIDSVRAAALAGLPELISRLGGDPEALLRAHGFTPVTASEPERRVSYADFIRLLEHCASELRCPDFGLRVGHVQDLQVLGPIAIVMRHSATVAEAIRSVARYLSFHTPGAMVALIDAADEPPGFNVEIVLPGLRRARQINELGMFLCQRMLELLLGDGYRSPEVQFVTEPPEDEAPLRRVFGARLEFGMPMNRFTLREAELRRPVRDADATVRRLIASHLDLARQDPGVPLVERVIRAIRTLLPSGRCSLPAVSDQLGFAPRSLQRALHQRGACFRELQEAQQRLLAEQLLRNPRLPLLRVATLSGFADQSTFNRAFARWCGESPGRWRGRSDSCMDIASPDARPRDPQCDPNEGKH